MIIATIGHKDIVLDSMDDAKALADIISRSNCIDRTYVDFPNEKFTAVQYFSNKSVELELKITNDNILSHEDGQKEIARLKELAAAEMNEQVGGGS